MKEYILPYSKQILRLEEVTTGYCDRKFTKIVSRKISSQINNGELVSLIGANGCGKSTLMRCIGGLQSVLSGQIYINNNSIASMSSKDRAKSLSFVLTDQIDAANLTVYDIVSNGRHPHIGYLGKLSQTDWNIIDHSLAMCSLQGWGERIYSSLSDGEKQRVLIARALAQDTPLMLLDEPTAHLDLPNRVEMMRMLNQLAKKTGKAILLSTHELDLAMQWSDTIWLMDAQQSLTRGIPEDIALSGKIGTTFCSKNIMFDMQTGSFKLSKKLASTIRLQGDGIERIWTERALERIGLLVDNENKEEPLLQVSNKGWQLQVDGTEYSSDNLEDVVVRLQHEEYWKSILRNGNAEF